MTCWGQPSQGAAWQRGLLPCLPPTCWGGGVPASLYWRMEGKQSMGARSWVGGDGKGRSSGPYIRVQ